jgi:hypothetical protein
MMGKKISMRELGNWLVVNLGIKDRKKWKERRQVIRYHKIIMSRISNWEMVMMNQRNNNNRVLNNNRNNHRTNTYKINYPNQKINPIKLLIPIFQNNN